MENQQQELNRPQRNNVLFAIRIVFVYLFFAVLLSGAVLLLVLERPSYSQDEKRELATMPSFSLSALYKGEYTEALQYFYNDTIPYRSELKRFSDRVLSYKGFAQDDVYIDIPGDLPPIPSEEPDGTLPPVTTPGTNAEEVPAVTPSQSTEKPNVNEFSQNQGIVTYKKRAMELYWGSKASMRDYALSLNTLQTRMPELNVWSMNIPISSAYYLPPSLAGKYGDQEQDCAYIRSLLQEGVYYVDVYNVLKKHVDEDIYLRTDHHWSYLGVFYAVEEMMKQANLPVPNLSDDYVTKSKDGNLGSFYLYFDQKHLVNYPETFTWYEPKFSFDCTYYSYDTMQVVKTSQNKMFFYYSEPFYDMVNYGDSYLTHVKTSANTGRKVAVFKDSFGNALAPFLAKGFDEIWVIDLRYFKGDAYAFLAEKGVTDVLMASCMFTNAGYKSSYYKNLFVS
ncbi:MAG: hypothetical protein IKU26_02760 [Clostridia bacterium]|nr:hypothetical protein [Clostridia bacterium]